MKILDEEVDCCLYCSLIAYCTERKHCEDNKRWRI